jgi:hypothetical protein
VSENSFEASRDMKPAAVAPMKSVLVILRGVAGGVLGGVVGFFVFQWLARSNLYGMVIPGAAVGLGAGLAARGRSLMLGVICALGAIALSVFAEWALFPFVKDNSLSFFLAHVHELHPWKLIMMGIGGVLAFWLGQGR